MPDDGAAQIDRERRVVQIVDTRMRVIIGTIDFFRLAVLVRAPAVGNGHGCQDHALLVPQRNVLADLQPVSEIGCHVPK